MACAPAAANSPLTVELVSDWNAFVELEPEWNALVTATDDQPFYRHEYLRSWIESFAPRAGLRLLAGRDAEGRLAAVLPLVERRRPVLGLPLVEWSSPTDVHSFRFDFVARDPVAATRAFLPRLRDSPGWSVVRITDVPDGGAAWELYRAARDAGLPGGVYVSQLNPYLALPASVDELRAGWTSKWRSNLRRRRKQLDQRGAVRFTRVTGGGALEENLERCFSIEESGWKGRRGEAANHDPRIRNFYLALARRTAVAGDFTLDLLEVGDRPIAFHYGLTRAGTYSLVMTSYDERFRECAPGHLLTEHVLERSIAAGLRELDFLGCDLEWKRAWTPTTREHSWLFLFRDSRAGALLAHAKFAGVPALRRMLAGRK
jgi:CelD/BcsL family acetyltransferase involved in cellulose biosynthesis